MSGERVVNQDRSSASQGFDRGRCYEPETPICSVANFRPVQYLGASLRASHPMLGYFILVRYAAKKEFRENILPKRIIENFQVIANHFTCRISTCPHRVPGVEVGGRR